MEVKIESSRLLKPAYEGIDDPHSSTTPELVKLSLFDKVTDDAHFAAICAFRAPNPPNSVWERSLAKVLTTFKEWAGRLGEDADGNPAIILNDEGVRFVEASVDAIHDDVMTSEPSPALLSLHPSPWGVEELAQFNSHVLLRNTRRGIHLPPQAWRWLRNHPLPSLVGKRMSRCGHRLRPNA
ncbi:agmatine hydroxycinnamoyltransferase 1-like [Typha latifolia]|uniref:agmatine hydroxycinnamoyltransferase 1-like n=1 Tax=Typha latifolia TaxID=4733 RepID=UPI003C2CADCC